MTTMKYTKVIHLAKENKVITSFGYQTKMTQNYKIIIKV